MQLTLRFFHQLFKVISILRRKQQKVIEATNMKFLTLTIFLISVVWAVTADVTAINVPAKDLDAVSSKVPEIISEKIPTEVAPVTPETSSTELPSEISDEAAILCGAAGSCQGIGGGALCHDRCRQCSGPSGRYTRGACCGTLWLTCCCYYN